MGYENPTQLVPEIAEGEEKDMIESLTEGDQGVKELFIAFTRHALEESQK